MNHCILTAIEPNDEGLHVWQRATQQGAQTGAKVHALNVIEPAIAVYADLNFTPLIECSTNWQTALIKEHKDYFKSRGIAGSDIIVEEGYPSQSIEDHAKHLDAKLIVMGIHNRRGLKRLLGSTTHNVLNHTSQNLLAVHPDSSNEPYKRVLVAIDTTDLATEVLKQVDLVSSEREKLQVISTIIPLATVLATPETSQMGWTTAELSKDIREQTQAKVTDLVSGAGYEPSEICLPEGDPRDEIIRVAEEMKADLIVIGSGTRGALGRLFLGSTARGVLNHTPCDVLVVRPS